MRNKKGFTMVELIVVVTIIAVMTAVSVPSIIVSNRRAEATKQNGHARSFYLAVHQTLSSVMQNDNSDQEFQLVMPGYAGSLRRATAPKLENTISRKSGHFILYVVMGNNARVEYADLAYCESKDKRDSYNTNLNSVLLPCAVYSADTEVTSDNALALSVNAPALKGLIEEIEGFTETVSEPGFYYAMFDTQFRVTMAYHSKFINRDFARDASGCSFAVSNRLNNTTFGAFPYEYSIIGSFDSNGASYTRTAGKWFGLDTVEIIDGI
jgi:prepilin-type N-terminal cleavage/methylation domain-containing protein